jgi:hypothetical protein
MTDTLVRGLDFDPSALQVKASSAAVEGGLGVVQQADDPMEFWIIGGVTGIVDEVKDIVEPGAYFETLKKRKPKIIKDHDWTHRLGKVLEIFEALPGDPRLPKTTARGDAWPADAGALMAKVRLFDTKEGRDAATRWTEEGAEQEFSIGYIARKARKDPRTDIRHIKTLDCFEISDVLWGAMPLAGPLPSGLATKMLKGIAADPEMKAATAVADEDVETLASDDEEGTTAPVVNDGSLGLFDSVDGVPVDAAADEEDLFDDRPETEQMADALDDEDEDEEDPEDIRPEMKAAMAAFLGAYEVKYDTSPVGSPGDKENWVDKVGGLPKFIRAIAHALIREGKTEQNAIQIAIGTVKRWAKGVGKVSAKTRAKAAKAVAEWEAKKAKARATKSVTASDLLAGLEGGALRMERDVRIKAYDPEVEEGPDAGVKPVDEAEAPAGMEPFDRHETGDNRALMPADDVVESKMYGNCLPGSYEERQRMIYKAAWEALRGDSRMTDNGERFEWDDLSVVAVYDDRAVVTRHKWGAGDTTSESFEFEYAIRGDVALISDPEEVRLVVRTQVEHGEEPAEDVALPFADEVDDVAVAMKTYLAAMETKAGRVLSAANESRLRAAVENLIGVLKVAGVEIVPPEAPAADAEGTEPAGAPTGTPPVEAKDLHGSGEVIDPADLPDPAAYAASLREFAAAHNG